MTIQEANKWLYQAEILDLCNGDTKDRQAVDVACRSLEAWEKVRHEMKVRGQYLNVLDCEKIINKYLLEVEGKGEI